MSKKSRRARAKFKTTQQVPRTEQRKQPEATREEIVPRVIKSVAESSTLSQAARYQHIVPELIRIGIIAGVLFLITIVLSFIIK